ncbi:MAG: hypothetical protein ACI9XO_000472 [Paraglaciecola sp.]
MFTRACRTNWSNNQKLTTGALHLSPATTEPISQAEGVFLIGLKNNQKELFTAIKTYAEDAPMIDQRVTVEKMRCFKMKTSFTIDKIMGVLPR